eukprot:6918879-Alexandrium_andersonii.AAC.1
MLSPRTRRWGNLLGNLGDDLRLDARGHRPAPPRPRDRRELLQGFAQPSLAEGAARHGSHLAHLAGTQCDDARSRTPTALQSDSGLPPGVEAAVHARRPNAVKHALAELVAVVAVQLAHQPFERRTPVMPDKVLREELPRMLHQPEHGG